MMSRGAAFCQEFQISTQSRVDLSGIHPLKRVTLIVLLFIFGVSLVLALAGHVVWMAVLLESPGSLLHVTNVKDAIVLVRVPLESNNWYWEFHYDENAASHPIYDSLLPVGAVHIPGMFIIASCEQVVVGIHHLWLISLTAALYFFTRWRIRRTARLQSLSS